MTVLELIEKLKNYPEDMDVVLDGYEYGYGDIYGVYKLIVSKEKVNSKSWAGDYDEDENGRDVVYIQR